MTMTLRQIFALGTMAFALAACGSGEQAPVYLEAAKSAREVFRANKEKDSKPELTAGQVAALGLQSKIKGPLFLATTQETNDATLLAVSARNGAYQTFATPTKQTVSMKRGVITDTRGLGYDLMWSQSDKAISLVTSRKSGSANRVHGYLTVEGTERVLHFDCTVTVTGSETLKAIGGGSRSTTKLTESCAGTEASFANQYWVLSNGTIWQSVQWVGPEYGAIVLQTLRR